MGYYASMELDFTVTDVEGLKELIFEINSNVDNLDRDSWKWNLLDARVVRSMYDSKYYLEYTDFCIKVTHTVEFAYNLAKYVSKGRLVYVGEDGDKWGYKFNGDGTVNYLLFEERIGELVLI